MGFYPNRRWADRRLRLAQGPNEVFLEQGPNEVGKAQMPSPSPRRLAAAGARRPPASVFVAIRAGGEARRVRPRVPGSRRRGDEETTDHARIHACSTPMRMIVVPAVVAKGSQGTALQVIRP